MTLFFVFASQSTVEKLTGDPTCSCNDALTHTLTLLLLLCVCVCVDAQSNDGRVKNKLHGEM